MTLRSRRADRDGAFAGNIASRAIIDIGSNTVRLVIYGGTMRAPTVLLNEKVTARLGRDIASTGLLAPEAVELALRGVKRFALLLGDLDITDIDTVATAAVRDAANGAEFIAQLEALGLAPRILSGEEEAAFSAYGVIGAFRGAEGLVADLGGGSLELARIADNAPVDPVTLPLGALRLPDYRVKGDPVAMRKALEGELAKKAGGLSGAERLYLVGGTWRAMAVFAMQERGHPLSDPHGFELSYDDAMSLAAKLEAEKIEALKSRNRISSMRAEKLPDAAVLLAAMLRQLKPGCVIFSSWGLREGILYEALPAEKRAQDPLLAGISVFAAQRGAPPTLSARMAAWTLDAAPARQYGSERLRLAATMLALASMQIEPNIRLPQAIDWALHKRWIAISGEERAMLAAAIAANGNQLDLPASLGALAGKDALEEAVRWGLAIRLARRMGARSLRSLQMTRLIAGKDELVLRLAESHEALFGIPVEKDLKLLASRMGVDYRTQIVPDDALYDPD